MIKLHYIIMPKLVAYQCGSIGYHEISDWSKKKVVDFEAPPAMSLGYDNLLFPFVIIIGGAAIAGQEFQLKSYLLRNS